MVLKPQLSISNPEIAISMATLTVPPPERIEEAISTIMVVVAAVVEKTLIRYLGNFAPMTGGPELGLQAKSHPIACLHPTSMYGLRQAGGGGGGGGNGVSEMHVWRWSRRSEILTLQGISITSGEPSGISRDQRSPMLVVDSASNQKYYHSNKNSPELPKEGY